MAISNIYTDTILSHPPNPNQNSRGLYLIPFDCLSCHNPLYPPSNVRLCCRMNIIPIRVVVLLAIRWGCRVYAMAAYWQLLMLYLPPLGPLVNVRCDPCASCCIIPRILTWYIHLHQLICCIINGDEWGLVYRRQTRIRLNARPAIIRLYPMDQYAMGFPVLNSRLLPNNADTPYQ